MAENTSVSANAKMGLAGWLTLTFVILKLNPGGYLDSAVQDWSWWLVFSPILIGVSFFLLLLLIAGGLFGTAALLDWNSKRKYRKRAAARRLNDIERFSSNKKPPFSTPNRTNRL